MLNRNVEAWLRTGARWRKSTCSEPHGACVEVTPVGEGFAVRDSKNPDGPVLRPVIKGWVAFIGKVKTGNFE